MEAVLHLTGSLLTGILLWWVRRDCYLGFKNEFPSRRKQVETQKKYLNGERIKSPLEGTGRGVPMTSPLHANAETRREAP